MTRPLSPAPAHEIWASYVAAATPRHAPGRALFPTPGGNQKLPSLLSGRLRYSPQRILSILLRSFVYFFFLNLTKSALLPAAAVKYVPAAEKKKEELKGFKRILSPRSFKERPRRWHGGRVSATLKTICLLSSHYLHPRLPF